MGRFVKIMEGLYKEFLINLQLTVNKFYNIAQDTGHANVLNSAISTCSQQIICKEKLCCCMLNFCLVLINICGTIKTGIILLLRFKTVSF